METVHVKFATAPSNMVEPSSNTLLNFVNEPCQFTARTIQSENYLTQNTLNHPLTFYLNLVSDSSVYTSNFSFVRTYMHAAPTLRICVSIYVTQMTT